MIHPTKEFIEQETSVMLAWFQKDENVFIKEFCINRGYTSSRLMEWGRINQEFLDAFNRCKEIQEIRIAKNGLNKIWNPWFTAFVMKNICGWKDNENTNYVEVTSDSEMVESRSKINDYLKSVIDRKEL